MTALNKAELYHLLNKEAQGTLTPGEQQQLDNWYNEFDKTQKDLEIFRDTEHEALIRQRLLNRIIEFAPAGIIPNKKTAKYRSLIRWSSAAAILLMLTGGLLWKYVAKRSNQHEILLSCETGNGNIKKITLEDGSDVWLNAGSKLRYPAHFTGRHREVYLEGEAYFDIIHDPSKPFAVITDRLTTNVLGTAFSVTAYKNVPVRVVAVVRGKVQVANGDKILGFLTPNKQIEYNVKNGTSRLSDADATARISWKEGKLQFENQDMQDITARLGRWYGYSFRFEHTNLKNCRYTASFNSNIPLSNLLKVMKAISLIRYKIDTTQKTVTFLGTGCNE